MSKLGLLCLLVVAAAAQTSFDPRLSIHTIVREDVFAGLMASDNERMARGEKTIDLLLAERPDAKAALISWKGSIALKRAVDAHEAKRAAAFEAEYRKALGFYAEAAKLGPTDGGVQAVTAASYAYFADRLPEQYRRAAWDTSYASFREMWKGQAAGVDRMPLHLKGELLAGMAQTAHRTGRTAEASEFVERILTSMPGTAYAALAQKWKDSPETAAKTNLVCHSCHESGRLEARKATLAAAK